MDSKNFQNSKKLFFLDSIPQTSLDNDSDKLTLKCKFNFAYFNGNQEVGQSFIDWNHNELVKLLEKMINYSESSLLYWQNEKAGNYNLFSIYDTFPTNTEFIHPKNIPHQVKWARFHLENKVRLVGFVVPDEYHDTIHQKTEERFDKNTFYIVFLDKNHLFYKTK